MSPTSSHKGAIRYRFYISTALTFKSKKAAGSVKRVSAQPLETAVLDALRARFPRAEGGEQRSTAELETTAEQPAMTAERQLIETQVERITLSKGSVVVALKPKPGDAESDAGNAPARAETIVIPFKPKRGRPRRDILHALDNETDTNSGVRADTRQLLLRGIAKARNWASELADGRTESIEAIAAREEYSPRYVRQMLPLAFLAPDIITAIFANTVPADLGISRLIDGLPYSWKQQQQKLGC